jgi:hypothetical protein
LNFVCSFGYVAAWGLRHDIPAHPGVAVTPSPRTLHTELLRLCARIGYSPHASA